MLGLPLGYGETGVNTGALDDGKKSRAKPR